MKICTLLIVDPDISYPHQSPERFLLIHRVDEENGDDWWETPGGKLNPGESAPACGRREAKEELGVDVAVNHEVDSGTKSVHGTRISYTCLFARSPVPLDDIEPQEAMFVEARAVTFSEARELPLSPITAAIMRNIGWKL